MLLVKKLCFGHCSGAGDNRSADVKSAVHTRQAIKCRLYIDQPLHTGCTGNGIHWPQLPSLGIAYFIVLGDIIQPCSWTLYLMMDSAILYSVYAVTVIFSTAQAEGTCQTCNCQFNNVQLLNQLIESKIASGKQAKTVRLAFQAM